MMTLVNYLKARFASKKGQGLVEYGLIIGLVAVIIITVMAILGDPFKSLFQTIGNFIANTTSKL